MRDSKEELNNKISKRWKVFELITIAFFIIIVYLLFKNLNQVKHFTKSDCIKQNGIIIDASPEKYLNQKYGTGKYIIINEIYQEPGTKCIAQMCIKLIK